MSRGKRRVNEMVWLLRHASAEAAMKEVSGFSMAASNASLKSRRRKERRLWEGTLSAWATIWLVHERVFRHTSDASTSHVGQILELEGSRYKHIRIDPRK